MVREGYLLTGRHGFFASYEAFIRVVDSMCAQHAKWLKVCKPASVGDSPLLPEPDSYIQWVAAGSQWIYPSGSGVLDHIANKKADVVRLYLPPDTNVYCPALITASEAAPIM